jgi:hypothetical protein
VAKSLNRSNASGDLSPSLDSRRRLLKTGLFSWGVLALGGAVSRSAFAQSDEDCDALFVLSARGLEFDGSVLTLKETNPTVVYFCDRPVREAGHMTLEALTVQVQKGENNFRENPPNAAISIFEDDGSVKEVVVVLPTAPVIAGDTVKFEVVGIDGDLPAAGGAVSMFIDPIGMPLSPTSAAGVHRRHRRRAIRRHN